jgi:hypothetical protein
MNKEKAVIGPLLDESPDDDNDDIKHEEAKLKRLLAKAREVEKKKLDREESYQRQVSKGAVGLLSRFSATKSAREAITTEANSHLAQIQMNHAALVSSAARDTALTAHDFAIVCLSFRTEEMEEEGGDADGDDEDDEDDDDDDEDDEQDGQEEKSKAANAKSSGGGDSEGGGGDALKPKVFVSLPPPKSVPDGEYVFLVPKDELLKPKVKEFIRWVSVGHEERLTGKERKRVVALIRSQFAQWEREGRLMPKGDGGLLIRGDDSCLWRNPAFLWAI